MSELDAPKRSPIVVVLAVVGGLLALLGCGGVVLVVLVFASITMLGSSLDNTFEEVAKEVEAAQP